MSEYKTNWVSLNDRSAILETTGGINNYRKWVQEPNETGKWMREFLPKESTICDFGCGVGRNAGILPNYFTKVICTDLHSNMPEQSDYPLNLFPYGVLFDVDEVLSAYVMQHIPPELFPEHFHILKESEWKYLFLLESGSDFKQDYRGEIKKFSTLVFSEQWKYEGCTEFNAEVYEKV